MKALILLTNDDGFYSDGIEALGHRLENLGEIFIVAPDRERSATSLSLTLHRPLRVKRIRENVFAVDGTPADCVYLALQKFLPRKPDLLISGINSGPNLGQQDVSYSGTVAAAIQGTFLQVQSLAISCLHDEKGRFHFDTASEISHRMAKSLLQNKLPEGITLNVNLPPPPFKGIKITRLGQRRYNPEIVEEKDPRKTSYYWIGTGNPKTIGDEESDVTAVSLGFISITPLHPDLTDFQALKLQALKDIFSFIDLGES